jgi:hypothetical protein
MRRRKWRFIKAEFDRYGNAAALCERMLWMQASAPPTDAIG